MSIQGFFHAPFTQPLLFPHILLNHIKDLLWSVEAACSPHRSAQCFCQVYSPQGSALSSMASSAGLHIECPTEPMNCTSQSEPCEETQSHSTASHLLCYIFHTKVEKTSGKTFKWGFIIGTVSQWVNHTVDIWTTRTNKPLSLVLTKVTVQFLKEQITWHLLI